MKITSKYSMVGFIIALVIISMMASYLAIFMDGIATEYDLDGNGTIFDDYDLTGELVNSTKEIKDQTDTIGSGGNWLTDTIDLVGVVLKSGVDTIRTAANSFSLFLGLMDEAEDDGEFMNLGFFIRYIVLIIIIIIFLGIIGAALLKWRI